MKKIKMCYSHGKNSLDAALLETFAIRTYVIESAERVWRGWQDNNTLKMKLREKDSSVQRGLGHAIEYSLVGEEIFEPFMRELGADSVDALVGKEVCAYVGLAARK